MALVGSGRDRPDVTSGWSADAPAYFESPAHRQGVLDGIAAGALPLRYAYAGSGAHTHDLFARSDGYGDVTGTVPIEVEALGYLAPYPDLPPALVEIGPGNGLRTTAVLAHLYERGATVRRYLGLDFSGVLLARCRARLSAALGTRLKVHTGLWDVESEPSPLLGDFRDGDGPVVVGLFGQTLGSVEDIRRTMANIHASLAPADLLMITVALHREGLRQEEVLAPYRTDAFRTAVLEPFRAAGVDVGHLELHIGLTGSGVVGEVVLRSPTIVGQRRLEPGHTVRCFRSRLFEAARLPQLFDPARWSLRRVVFEDTSERAVVIAAKRAGAA